MSSSRKAEHFICLCASFIHKSGEIRRATFQRVRLLGRKSRKFVRRSTKRWFHAALYRWFCRAISTADAREPEIFTICNPTSIPFTPSSKWIRFCALFRCVVAQLFFRTHSRVLFHQAFSLHFFRFSVARFCRHCCGKIAIRNVAR